jgi:hypothetical protein
MLMSSRWGSASQIDMATMVESALRNELVDKLLITAV